MPLGLSFSSKPKQSSTSKMSTSSTDLRSSSARHQHQRQQQQQQQHQHQPQYQNHQALHDTYSNPSSCFSVHFLGKQSLTRPSNSTGFGCVQKPLREIYLGHVLGGRQMDSSSFRTMAFVGSELQIRQWVRAGGSSSSSGSSSSRSQQQQQLCDAFPHDSVAYAEMVLLHTVKGRKRHFAYFRRRTDASDVIPDTVLIPLQKKEHKLVSKHEHPPLICLLLRRPHGIQFLECHLFAVESEAVGERMLVEFDSLAAGRLRLSDQQQQQQRGLFNYAPWQPNRWSSQPHLANAAPAAAAAAAPGAGLPPPAPRGRRPTVTAGAGSDASLAATPSSTSSASGSYRRQQQQQQAPPQPAAAAAAADGSSSSNNSVIRRTASGTIFDKYSELQQFNIPEYEYFGFQELRPPPASASDNNIRNRQRPVPVEHRPSVILEESNKSRGENVSQIVHQFEQIRTDVKPVARVAPTARPPLPRQRSGGSSSSSSGTGGSGGRKQATRSSSASSQRRKKQKAATGSNPDFLSGMQQCA